MALGLILMIVSAPQITPAEINNSTTAIPPQGQTVSTEKVVEQPEVQIAPTPETQPVVEPVAAPITEVIQQAPPAQSITGDKLSWMAAAGIAESDYGAVDYIISHESSWNPNAMNSIGACGLAQQLPCGKWEHQWNDPVGALIDATSYANQRYGSWWNAYNFWTSHNWW